MKHTIIVTGGCVNIDFCAEYIKSLSYDRLFAVDKGLEYVQAMGLTADCVLGDFDTVKQEVLLAWEKESAEKGKNTIERYSPRKDATDTELAVWKAMEENSKRITLLGAIGSRMDHVLANIFLLKQTIERGVNMEIVNETNRIRVLDGVYCSNIVIKKEEQHGKYVSIVPISDKVENMTLQGAEYPLNEETIYRGSSRTISNEIADSKMRITIKKGQALLIESRDAW